MLINIDDGDNVTRDKHGNATRIDKPNTLICITRQSDGTIMAIDFHKKLSKCQS